MERKLVAAVLCFLGLCVVVQSWSLEQKDVAKYEPCFTYANCNGGKESRQRILQCVNKMNPQEVKSFYTSIEKDYNWSSKNFYDALNEYCKVDPAKLPDAFDESFVGVNAYYKKVCPANKEDCDAFKKNMDCAFAYLDELKAQGKC